MKITSFFENGEKVWETSLRNTWTGKVIRKKFKNEKDASLYLQKYEETRAREKKILEQKKHRKISKNITVYRLLKLYFKTLENKTTVKQSGYHASQIVDAFGRREVRTLTFEDVSNFIEMQKVRGCAQITINRRVSVLRTAISWAVRQKIIETNPLKEYRLPKSVAKKIYPPTLEELRSMLKFSPRHITRVILIGLYTGVRVGPSELFKLEWTHIDFDRKMIYLPCAEKNSQIDIRLVPINQLLFNYLKKWREEDKEHEIPYLIHYEMKPIKTIAKAWKNTLALAGIKRTIRPYDLRHAYATYAIAGGADIKTVAEIMGHSDASMILKTYQHVQIEQKRQAVDIIPSI